MTMLKSAFVPLQCTDGSRTAIACRALHPCRAEARRAGEVLQRAIRIADPEIAAARRGAQAAELVAEGGGDGREVAWQRHLGDEVGGARQAVSSSTIPPPLHPSPRRPRLLL